MVTSTSVATLTNLPTQPTHPHLNPYTPANSNPNANASHDGCNCLGVRPSHPILNYHRFTPNLWDETSGMVRYLGDLKNDLQAYYDSGYS